MPGAEALTLPPQMMPDICCDLILISYRPAFAKRGVSGCCERSCRLASLALFVPSWGLSELQSKANSSFSFVFGSTQTMSIS